MTQLHDVLRSDESDEPLEEEAQRRLVPHLSALSDAAVYGRSITRWKDSLFFLTRRQADKHLGIIYDPSSNLSAGFEGHERSLQGEDAGLSLLWCPASPENANQLRQALPFTAPKVLGLVKSVGCGDRLGLATPGHIRAVRKHSLAPVLAQQSIREMSRTGPHAPRGYG